MSNFDELIKSKAQLYRLDWLLIKAVCIKESNMDNWASRYEPMFKHTLDSMLYARANNISRDTEFIQQKTSWGLMQVMGAVARECGHKDKLTKLLIPEVGLDIGCKKLSILIKKHADLRTALAAYNAGSGNVFAGMGYANSVLEIYDKLKKDIAKQLNV